MARFEVRVGSQSQHCCFYATVVDTTKPFMIGDEQYCGRTGPEYEEVCECFDEEAADRIAAALNRVEGEK